ncbi:hypothetical protein BROUX41_002142 [Berkeleyomyces rouxiae]|uniref:uncharacterized protein n=1 Tax=Berkeleyomyces rouxiae TaxID=2035830 RepID=UPI003B79F4D5
MRFYFLATLASATVVQAGEYYGVSSLYSFDLHAANNIDWMASIPDNIPMSSLSIPGTHNSVNYATGQRQLQCQNNDLEEQFKAGIRYLDISARADPFWELLKVYGTGGRLDYSVANIFISAADFVEQHPGETIIMHVNNDRMRSSDDATFEKCMTKYFKSSNMMSDKVKDRLYTPDHNNVFSIPTMGEIRGKIVILEDFATKTPGRFGIPWKSSEVIVTDVKLPITHINMLYTWNKVKSALKDTRKDKTKKLHITHMNAAPGSIAAHAAGGTTTMGKGLNDRLGERLKAGKVGRTGVVVMDFPGRFLVEQIIGLNKLG